jgi:hypothetical protein
MRPPLWKGADSRNWPIAAQGLRHDMSATGESRRSIRSASVGKPTCLGAQSSVTVALKRRRFRFALSSASRRSFFAPRPRSQAGPANHWPPSNVAARCFLSSRRSCFSALQNSSGISTAKRAMMFAATKSSKTTLSPIASMVI